MLVLVRGRLFGGFGHGGGLRHGSLAGFHILGVVVMIALTVVLAAGLTTLVSSWVAKRTNNEDSTKAAAWVTFLLVFVALGWLTLRFA